jgi:hypothetical protein
VADLDADGVDEILKLEERNDMAVLSTTLTVFRVDGAAIRGAGRLELAFDNKGQKGITTPRLVRCSGRHALADGPGGTRLILVEGRIEKTGREARGSVQYQCPRPGSHRYRLTDGKLVEVSP